MFKFLTLGIFYLGAISFVLYFFSCAYYIDTPGGVEYSQNIDKFYDQLLLKLSQNNIKISKLFNKDSYIASLYRHIICGKYIKNANKMKEVGFSNNDIVFYQENIGPVYSVRNTMYLQANMSIICFIIGIILIKIAV